MKNILVILADYYPNASSNTYCLEPYLKELEENRWELDIITRKSSKREPDAIKEPSGRNIYKVEDDKLMNTLGWEELTNCTSIIGLKTFNLICSFLSKSLFYLYFCFGKYETYSAGWSEKEVLRLLKKLNKEKKYQFILSVSFPEKTHEIAKKFVEQIDRDCKWLLLEFDPFCYNKSNYKKRFFKKLFKIQEINFEACYKILCTPQLKNFYMETSFSKYDNKMAVFEYANLQKPSINYNNVIPMPFENNKISCLFCGVIKKDIRNPDRLFEVFFNLPNQYKLIIMSGSNLKSWSLPISALGDKIEIWSQQNKDTALDSMSRSDILINIGNSIPYQIPGKLFEYMSFAKPIIHISNMLHDPAFDYLRNYPLALIIEKDEKAECAAKNIEEFYRKTKGQVYTFEEISLFLNQVSRKNTTVKFVEMLNGKGAL